MLQNCVQCEIQIKSLGWFVCNLQLHLRGGPGVCADGDWGSERAAAVGWLDRRRWYFLPWRVYFQHVRNEPCTLQTVPRGQKTGAIGSSTTCHLYIFWGQECSPNPACLRDCWHCRKWNCIRDVCVSSLKYDWKMLTMMCSFGFVFFQSHYSVKKAAAFLGIGTDNVILVNVDDG